MSMRERGSGGVMRDTNTALGVVIIVVAVVVAVVLLHHSGSTKAATVSTTSSGSTTTILPGDGPTTTTATGVTTPGAATTTTVPGATTTTLAPVSVKVLVLNGASFTLPLATEFTEKVKDLGYTTLTPNNAAGVVKASQIYVETTGFAPEADALAKSLGLTSAAVVTTPTTNTPLSAGTAATGANLVLVVGPDLAAKG